MKQVIFSLIALLLSSSLLPDSAFSQALSGTDAEKAVSSTIDEVKKLVADHKGKISEQELDKKIEVVLLPNFDFDQMSKSSLGAGWKKATPPQQDEFVKLFTSLLARSYLAKIRKNVETSKVSFLPTSVKEDRVVVHSKVLSDGQDIAIDYRMYLRDGKYKVYDVMVENIGLVSNYRSEFSGILDSGNFEELLTKVRAQVAKAGSDTSR